MSHIPALMADRASACRAVVRRAFALVDHGMSARQGEERSRFLAPERAVPCPALHDFHYWFFDALAHILAFSLPSLELLAQSSSAIFRPNAHCRTRNHSYWHLIQAHRASLLRLPSPEKMRAHVGKHKRKVICRAYPYAPQTHIRRHLSSRASMQASRFTFTMPMPP